MSSYQITGRLIDKGYTQQISDKFKKREFVIDATEVINGNTYSNFIKAQLVNTKCDLIENFQLGALITVSFNVKGNKYEKDGKTNYITNLDAWRIEPHIQQGQQPQYAAPQPQPQASYQPQPTPAPQPQQGAMNFVPGQQPQPTPQPNQPWQPGQPATKDDLPF